MCVIASKPAGIALPSEETLEAMWFTNPDGAGFMYAADGRVHIEKGFMKYEDLTAALDELGQKYDLTDLPMVMHFRITTHGGTKPENCHPFPVTDSIGLMSKPKSKCKLGVAHNGIIPITPRKGISDTMEYIATQLAPLYRAVPTFYRDKNLVEMISNAIHSKLAILNAKGEIYTIGNFEEKDGILYSNLNHEWENLRNTKWTASYSWDDYDLYGKGWYDEGHITSGNWKAKGLYHMETVMWVDENFGYLTGVKDYDPTEYFAVNRDGDVFMYNYDADALEVIPGATAWSNTGTQIRFNPDDPCTMREIVFEAD